MRHLDPSLAPRAPRRILAPLALLAALGAACGGHEEPTPSEAARSAPAGGAGPAAQARPSAESDGHERMRAALRAIADSAPLEHPWLGTQKVTRLRARLASLPETAPAVQRWRVKFRLGKAELDLGNEAAAIASFEGARALLAEVEAQIGPDSAAQTLLDLGIAYMRYGETQNCCLRHTPESCIAPLRGGGLHEDTEGSSKAIALFEQLLARPPQPSMESSIQRLTAIWLLNLAYMTLDRYPDDVPEAFRYPADAWESQIDFPRFENVLPGLGVDTFNLAGGSVADDFDGDGLIDVLTSTWDTTDGMVYLRNTGEGFEDRTAEAGLEGFFGGLNMVQADYDNDGDVDVLVLRGAWLGPAGRHPNSLLRNNGDNTFTDVTYAAGLAEPAYPTKTGAWGDYDLDGDLDLFVGNETSGADDDLGFYLGNQTLGDLDAPSQLFRNNGDGTFTDVAQAAGVGESLFVMGSAWGDYDGDRYPDLYVSAVGPNRLYHNQGDGTFREVGAALGVTEPLGSFPMWWWDYDNDGNLDLYVSASSGPVAILPVFPYGVDQRSDDPALAAVQDWARSWVQLPCLYRGDGEGGFEEVARREGLDWPTLPMGANFGDVDGDGYQDFYLATGSFLYSELRPNRLFVNRPGEGFKDVTTASGTGHLQKGHGVSFADFDNDGDLDLYSQLGGAAPGDKYSDALFENPGFGHRWLAVELVGVRSNRSGVGARLHARVRAEGGERSVYKHVGSGGSFGASPMRQTLGLGRSEAVIPLLEVFWPVTGETQVLRDVPADRAIRVVEGRDGFVPLELPAGRLGAGR